MTLFLLLILSSIPNIVVDTFYIPSSAVNGKINVQELLKKNSTLTVNLTSDEYYMNITQLASKYGYIIEQHTVTTEDGYILGLHRLIGPNNRTYGGISIFLMHGLLDSSDSWILQGPKALGYLLTEEGFDVWMGNARGNKYSLSHVDLSSKDEKFWKFSWEEIGVYDLPAMIDYILTMTGKGMLYYVGHSQGTTTFFVMNSLKPEYKNKIKMMFALSPIAWLSHAESPILKYLSTVPTVVLDIFQFFNTLTPSSDMLYQIYGNMCKVMYTGCGSVFEMLFGYNHFVNKSMLPLIVNHASSSSVLQFIHFWQLYQSGKFGRYDYGWMRNLYEYGSFAPPDYNLSDINVPIITFYSGNDFLSHPSDVSILHSHLPKVYKSYYSENFSHIDYIYASVARSIVYEKIIKIVQDYERQ